MGILLLCFQRITTVRITDDHLVGLHPHHALVRGPGLAPLAGQLKVEREPVHGRAVGL